MMAYMTFIIQSFIWSGYALIVWISAKDRLEYKALLFLIFFYFAYTLAKRINRSHKRAMIVTFISMGVYLIIYFQWKVI